MIVFYDILMLDERSLLDTKHLGKVPVPRETYQMCTWTLRYQFTDKSSISANAQRIES